MKKALIAIFLCAMAALSARGQVINNPLTANITAQSTDCSVANSCAWQLVTLSAGQSVVTLAGSFSGTFLVEQTNNGTTWTTAATLSSAGTTTYNQNGFTAIRVRCSSFVSGTAAVTISTGTGGSSSGSGGANPAQLIPGGSPTYLAKSCPSGVANCFVVNDDVQYAFTVACNNTSQTIATGVNDPPFVAGDVGKIIAGGDKIIGHASNCPPQGTITAFIDTHTVTVSNAATTTSASGELGWGHNDGAQIAAAFAASLGVGCLYLPQGAMFFDVPPFLDTRANSFVGPADCIIGTGQTLLTPLPSFNYSNCVGNSACVFVWPNGANQNPNYALLKDFEVFGLFYNLTGTGTNNNVFTIGRVTLENIWLWHWGNSIGTGMLFAGPDSAFSPISDSSGSTANCVITGSGGNATVQIFTPFCGENGQSISIAAGANLETFGGQYGPSGTVGPAETVNGNWLSVGEVHFAPGNTADTIRVGATGTMILDNSQVFGGTGNTLGAIDCNGSGGVVEFRGNVQVTGGSSNGVPIRSVAGCSIIDHAAKITITGAGSNSLSGNWFGNSSVSGTALVTGNIGLTSGWGASSVASVAANSDSRRGSFTITGASGSANPTLTLTFPTPFIVAPPSCVLWFGSSGATTDFTNVFASAPGTTSVVFNLIGTPTAVTIVFDYSCG